MPLQQLAEEVKEERGHGGNRFYNMETDNDDVNVIASTNIVPADMYMMQPNRLEPYLLTPRIMHNARCHDDAH